MGAPPDDHVLLHNIKLGDATALDQLFRRYYAGTCAVILFYLKDQQLAEEIGADVFVRFWEKRNAIVIMGNLKAYLFKIAKNMAMDHLQKKRAHVVPLENAANFSSTSSAEEHIYIRETLLQLTQSGNSLDELTRIVFTLSRDYQFKYREIAALLQVAEKTVESHMSKALRFLRNQIKD